MSDSSLVTNSMAARGYYQGNVAVAKEARKNASDTLTAAQHHQLLNNVHKAQKDKDKLVRDMIAGMTWGLETGEFKLNKDDPEEYLRHYFGANLTQAAEDRDEDEDDLAAEVLVAAAAVAVVPAEAARGSSGTGGIGGGRRSKARRSRKARRSKARRSKARRSKARRSKARRSKARRSKARRSKARRSRRR
jgi:hypothetical protein